MTETRHSWRGVQAQIRAWLTNGRYGPGDKLPRDMDIAAEIGCARSTVVRAMQELAAMGIVDRRRKGGTFAAAHRPTRAMLEIPVHRIDIEGRGLRYGYRLLGQQSEAPPPEAPARFRRAVPRCLRVRAVHLADDSPIIFEDRWIAVPVGAIDLTKISANEWLISTHPYDEIDVSCAAVPGDAALAEALGAPEGGAHLCLRRTTWNDGAPITHVASFYRAGHALRLTGQGG